jgi:hypothetical protein
LPFPVDEQIVESAAQNIIDWRLERDNQSNHRIALK